MLLNEMEVFYYVAELRSFSKAAERLNVSKSFISKKILKLERELKLKLITRTTRKLTLTEAGQNFYLQCSKVIQEANMAYSVVTELKGKPSGTLKISMPPALGLNLLAPMISNFIKTYPNIHLQIELENKLVDLIEENYDLVIRSAKLKDSNLIAQRLLNFNIRICAAPQYLKRKSIPKNPSDLTKHRFGLYSHSKNAKQLKLIRDNHEEIVHVNAIFLSNQLELIKKMVLEGICMGVFPEFMIKQELKDGQLKACLQQFHLTQGEFFIIYTERELMPLKLKIFLEELKKFVQLIVSS